MSTIFCDNDGCIFSDGCGFCDCDKLSIVDGVCEGSYSYGRNASDDDERLKAENAKLRELVRDMWCCISHIGEYDIFYYDMAKDGCGMSCTVNGEHCCADKLHDRMRELGIEVKS